MNPRSVALCVLLPILGFGCEETKKPVVISSKVFTEAVILGAVISEGAKAKGAHTEFRPELGGTQVCWNAMLNGEIDAYVEYTGTLAREILASENITSNAAMREHLRGLGIVMSDSLGFNNTYALGMKRKRAEELGVETMSDLNKHPELRFGMGNEFVEREDGWKGLRSAYGFEHKNVTGMSHELAYRGLDEGSVDVMELYTTDAEIKYYDIKVLRDDKAFFPSYEAVVLYRDDAAKRDPVFSEWVKTLAGEIDQATMIGLNSRAKMNGERESVIAAGFLASKYGLASDVAESTLLSRLTKTTVDHLGLVAISLFVAILFAIPLGVVAARFERLGQLILGAVGILQTVPSLALLVFMIPLLGVGTAPAVVALLLYSLLPIVRNTHAGIVGIDAALMESARAIGLDAKARLRLVELPLASPSILAGIKTSAVINVGTATLGAFIGAGGYGQPILTGIRRDDLATILEGAIPAAILALIVQGVFELVERRFVPKGLRL